jgi:hypothetical protein
MTQPIQPPAPVNTVVTIQPVTSSIPNRESAAAPNPLANIASGTTVEGFVVNRDAQNNPIVRTALGDLRVTSDVFLKTGSEIVFKVDASQASLARILTVDGLTPEDYNAQNTRGLTRDTISPTLLQPQSAATTGVLGKQAALATAPLLQALILQGQPQESLIAGAIKASQSGTLPLLAQLAQLRAGTPIRLAILDLKLPPLPLSLSALPDNKNLEALLPPKPNAAGAASTASANTPTTSSPTTGGASPASQPVTNSIAPAQAGTTARVNTADAAAPTGSGTAPIVTANETDALLTPLLNRQAVGVSAKLAERTSLQSELISNYGKTASNPSAAYSASANNTPREAPRSIAVDPSKSAPNQVNATVIGHEADGANILHTPFATLKLYTPQPLPTGTTLVVQASHEEAAPAAAAAPPATFIEEATRRWESLDDVMTFLKQTNNDVALEVQQRLPNVNHKLTSSLLFFIAAIKGGDMSEILGKRALRLLESSAPTLLEKLKRDITTLRGNLIDSPLTHWSVAQLPMLFGQELQQVRLYIAKDPADEKPASTTAERGQRFVLEVGMSQLGTLQLDGFLRQADARKNFDLIVRSRHSLDTDITQGISSLFHTSMEVTGMRGQVLFQVGEQHFVKPVADGKTESGGNLPNTILA